MLRSVYICGSSVILSHYNDVDMIYYYDTKEEVMDALIHNHDHSVNKHFALFDDRFKVFLGCYAYPFMKKVDGEDIDFASFSIFEHKAELKAICELTMEFLRLKDKSWYHILALSYMFENGEMVLNEEQLAKVQEVHDNGIDKNTKKYCVDIISNLQ